MSVNWGEIEALAALLSDIVLTVSLLLVLHQLRQQGQSQFVEATSDTFNIFLDDDFQRAEQWILYELKEQSWRSFVQAHRGQYGERAFIRVGAFYNRVGYLITHHLIGGLDQLLLDVIAGPAIQIWQKFEPLVLEARLVENSTLFQDFEQMLPACFACYAPGPPLPKATSGSSPR